jgi:CO/xanthine dehydrogenase FAD-binding subunit
MRLGSFPCELAPGSHAAQVYGRTSIYERHRHRYEFNNSYREQFTAAGMIQCGISPDELLVEMIVPPIDGLRTTYWKLRRRGAIDFPILGVAVAIRLDDGGTCTHARLVLGAVAPAPLEAPAAEQVLIGKQLTPEVIEDAAQAAFKPAKPLDNADLTLYYRKQMIRVYVARALKELAGLPAEEPPTHV